MHTFAAKQYTRSLTRKQLARYAYDIACMQLKADADAGLIPADAALLKFRRLRAAFERRKEGLGLHSFLRGRGYGFVLGEFA